jgi:hypothetical protein
MYPTCPGGTTVERPHQLQFDYFVRFFEPLDPDLNVFCQNAGWTLRKNPFREPERDLVKHDRMRIIISIVIDGDWRNMPVGTKPFCNIAVSGIYQPVSDLGFYRRTIIKEHISFTEAGRNLESYLELASQEASRWELPVKTLDGCYGSLEGWCVASKHTLSTD